MTWAERFQTFFNRPEFLKELATICSAEGCRETWLHGNAFIHFNTRGKQLAQESFRVNSHPLSAQHRGGKIDFAAYEGDQLRMIAECKFLGVSDYYAKGLAGCGINRLKQLQRDPKRRGLTFTRDDFSVFEMGAWSLLRDYQRLSTSWPAKRDVERYLILVLDKSNTPDSFGALLDQAEFGGPHTPLIPSDIPNLAVKLWRVETE